MGYILHSVPVQLRKSELMVPPISMYHLRKILALKKSGLDFERPTEEQTGEIIDIMIDVIRENYPEMSVEDISKELDMSNIASVISASQSLPKNAMTQAGMTKTVESPTEQVTQS